MKHRETIGGLFWLAVGLGLSVWSLAGYEIGKLTQPGPGYLPLALGIILVLLSLILLVTRRKKAVLQKETASSPASRGGGWRKVSYAVLVLAVAGFFFETVGYLLTFFLLIVLLMKGASDPQSWKRIVLTAFLTAVGVYVIFVWLLEQPLPRGLLGV